MNFLLGKKADQGLKYTALFPRWLSESQRDSVTKPRVARHELPWEIVRKSSTPSGLRKFFTRSFEWENAYRDEFYRATLEAKTLRNPVGVGPSSDVTQGSPMESGNPGLCYGIPLGFICCRFLIAISILMLGLIFVRAETSVSGIQNSPIENFFQLTTNIFSGATPAGDAAFAELQKHGVKTIISVDGAKPDAETAKRFGMRYVHLPVGYNGISTNRQLELIKVARTLPGPIFIHCHHGEHRGPTAAAHLCMGTANWTSTESFAWMKQARTSTNYAGLYASVSAFQLPDGAMLTAVPDHFPEHAQVSSMIEAMVAIDERMENLKAVKSAGYKPSPAHPDVVPAQEALLLHELFKELLRNPVPGNQTESFVKELEESERSSGALQLLLSNDTFAVSDADAAFSKVMQSCTSCHREFRN